MLAVMSTSPYWTGLDTCVNRCLPLSPFPSIFSCNKQLFHFFLSHDMTYNNNDYSNYNACAILVAEFHWTNVEQWVLDGATYLGTETRMLSGEPGLLLFPLILHLHTSCLTLSHRVLLRQEKGRQWRKRSGGKIHSVMGNCAVIEAGCPSCCQPVLKPSYFG